MTEKIENDPIAYKLVDCETYEYPDRIIHGKGSKFCLTLTNENRTILKEARSCAPQTEIDDLKYLFPTLMIEDGCYDGITAKSELCLCSTDKCNSGIHKQNIVVQLWALEVF